MRFISVEPTFRGAASGGLTEMKRLGRWGTLLAEAYAYVDELTP